MSEMSNDFALSLIAWTIKIVGSKSKMPILPNIDDLLCYHRINLQIRPYLFAFNQLVWLALVDHLDLLDFVQKMSLIYLNKPLYFN